MNTLTDTYLFTDFQMAIVVFLALIAACFLAETSAKLWSNFSYWRLKRKAWKASKAKSNSKWRYTQLR